MKAITFDTPGGPEVLYLGTVPDPSPGEGEVLVRVHATAVNRADLMQRAGHYPPPPGASEILGLECAGEIIDIPAGTHTHLVVGQRVLCLLSGGGYAEMVAVPIGQVMPVPDGLNWEQAAAIPEAFLTAWIALVTLGNGRPGDVALVHSIASGVGTAAAQMCAAMGIRCIGTSRSLDRAEVSAQWGAEAIAVGDGGFADAVTAMTGQHGADIIVDLVGAKYLAENVACLARSGRIILTGLVGGRTGELDLGTLLARQGRVIGTTLRGRTTSEKAAIVTAFSVWALPRFAYGTLTPVIHQVLPLAQAGDAHHVVGSNMAVGKVILTVAG
jgi:putative PIG3 family NAD(P)H quinone oxidoreductase